MGSSDLLVRSCFRSALKEYTGVLVKLVILDIVLWVLTWSSNVYVEPVSRRFANLTYILWTVSPVPRLDLRVINNYYYDHDVASPKENIYYLLNK